MFKTILPFIFLLTLTVHANSGKLDTRVYGYLEGYVEKVEKQPSRINGTSTQEGSTIRTKNAHEFNTPNINFMVKSRYQTNYEGFLNLSGADGADVTVKNAWVQSKLYKDLMYFRIGKLYRPFGLYNEQLDAVPTYIGIEPPELFDGDHLLLTRTTNTMIHGRVNTDHYNVRYALTTGNDERFSNQIPLGADLKVTRYGDNYELLLGSSLYFSSKAKPSKTVGSGSPDGGVLNWMEHDTYNVVGLYSELTTETIKLQAAYFKASHDAKRSGSSLRNLATGKLNDRQISRLCNGNCSTASDSNVEYDVKTWYVRLGKTFKFNDSEIIPYIQWDYYSNPETLADKNNGGDNEAGIADDGKFNKQTIGVVYRPIINTALKLDISNHSQKIENNSTNYAEARFSYSLIWSL